MWGWILGGYLGTAHVLKGVCKAYAEYDYARCQAGQQHKRELSEEDAEIYEYYGFHRLLFPCTRGIFGLTQEVYWEGLTEEEKADYLEEYRRRYRDGW